ncbi:JmjC domain, hydroxylase-domain-containing protein [Mycena olivaceomarginata]|nr:JmjC domain, hydroxylase-domain-containing protein [Mycena olivaceomarginata]
MGAARLENGGCSHADAERWGVYQSSSPRNHLRRTLLLSRLFIQQPISFLQCQSGCVRDVKRATFAWHVEDIDLFSINYIYFGAPKFWYAVPQARAGALKDTMRGYFPKDTSQCPQFLRHKSFLASPTLLAQSAVRPNHLVQHAGEFVITYPAATTPALTSASTAQNPSTLLLDSWLDEGRKAAVCKCVDYSVRIDVDQLLEDRRIEALEKTDPAAAACARAVRDGLEDVDAELELASATASASAPDPQQHKPTKPHPTPEAAVKRSPCKRKPTAPFEIEPDAKRARTVSASSSSHSRAQPKPITINLAARPLAPASYASSSSSFHAHPQPHAHAHAPAQKLTLKLGPPPASLPSGASSPLAEETFPCCLCVDPSPTGLARVHDLPPMWRELAPAARLHFPQQRPTGVWMAHEGCAMVLPETWVDEIDGERVVFGVDGIVHGRNAPPARARGSRHMTRSSSARRASAPKAFHVTCAQNGTRTGTGIAYTVVRDVEKEVILLEPTPGTDPNASLQTDEPNLRVLKVIRKTEIEALCARHNAVIVAECRASKAEGLRADILALAPLSRIKVRVSAGVFTKFCPSCLGSSYRFCTGFSITPIPVQSTPAPGPTPPASNLTIASAPNPVPALSPVSMQPSSAMQVDVPPVAA